MIGFSVKSQLCETLTTVGLYISIVHRHLCIAISLAKALRNVCRRNSYSQTVTLGRKTMLRKNCSSHILPAMQYIYLPQS